MDKLILAIVGSRKLEGHPDLETQIALILDAYNPSQVVSGGAIGVDQAAVRVAKAWGIPTDEKKPQPTKGGKAEYRRACFARNTLIAEASDVVVGIMLPGGTGGTQDTLDKATRMGKRVQSVFLAP